MKRSKKILIIILSIIFIIAAFLLLVFPGYAVYRVYQKTEDWHVMIEGVEYKLWQNDEWGLPDYKIGNKIGYLGGIRTSLYETDTNGNFVHVDEFFAENHWPLVRADYIVHEPSAETVDKLVWSEGCFEGGRYISYNNTVEDKDIIRRFFEAMKSDQVYYESNFAKQRYSINICCYSNDIPGNYLMSVYVTNDKQVCCNNNKYIVIPLDILEEMAGHEIDISKMTGSKN